MTTHPTTRPTAHRTTRRTVRTTLVAALLAALTTSTTSTSGAAAARPAAEAAGVALPVPVTATVTTGELGAGSVLAVVSHGRFEKVHARGLRRSLEVVTPDGVRHPVYTVAVAEDRDGFFPGDFTLVDWRPELHAALLRVSLGVEGEKVVSYDVTTGATREVALPRRASTVALDPDGSGLLLATYDAGRRPGRVGTLRWDGTRHWLPAHDDGTPITSPDGRTLVTPYGEQWWVTDLATRTSTPVDVPGVCAPQRWDGDAVVATCNGRLSSQLRLVRLDGTSTRLGVRHTERTRRHGPAVFDDADVRTVQGRSYYESYGGCGGAFLTRQHASGRVRVVDVPGWEDSTVRLLGTSGDRLLLARTADDCDAAHPGGSLGLFDPVTRQVTDLTVLGRREAWRELLPTAEVHAWLW